MKRVKRVKTSAQVSEYCALHRELSIEYENYAKSLGMTYSSLRALFIIYDNPKNCTQKTICDACFLPKQTVHQITTALYKQGLITMVEVESDRRFKTLHLTESGLEYAQSKVSKIKEAENKAMDSLNQEQQTALIEATRLYLSHFHDFMTS
ncbi:MAG: MarR family transcriptional regulator [Clostridiales bacterium]|nr:MarR family transcriptional regulator [Clostridiales bacterium]